jgi:CIC family chloride channel protein
VVAGLARTPVSARRRPVSGARSAAALGALLEWLGGSRLGLVAMALLVGAFAGLGAVLFRWLIYAITWLASGHQQFGQQGRVGSLHLPGLGIWFLLVIPVIGGLIYGPLIQRFAREARGHGVPEVMLAVSENGGRIRPRVTIVKALASALCIGTGGSLGREGPIVQVGSALASTLGQRVRMSEGRLRVIVACGAAGGIAATFNAPITGMFFGFEIVLREFSLDALFATILSAVTADLVSRAFFGSGPFFAALPHDLTVPHASAYLLVALLGLCSGLLGVGFKAALYGLEDFADDLWRGRPEWGRPAVGGVALGLLLLALPQMYGVGYPVMEKVLGGHEALWFVVILMLGKILAASLTLSIGGSGGVFAPSLFTGAAGGVAFGTIARHVFGGAVGPPELYGVIAMGGVFAAAAQAPLTAIASVVEMTGNFGITLSVMLASGIAAALAKRLGYGSIYTTKLLRRGVDIERPKPTSALETLTVADVMHRVPDSDASSRPPRTPHLRADAGLLARQLAERVGPITDRREPQALFAEETLDQALRQLVLYGHHGLPVLSRDERQVRGWLTRESVLHALSERISASTGEIERGALAAGFAADTPGVSVHTPSVPMVDHEILEIAVGPDSPARGHRLDSIAWPAGCRVVALSAGRELVAPPGDRELDAGDRVVLLAPVVSSGSPSERTLAGATELAVVPDERRAGGPP